jgi:hypothetical protein
MPEMFKMFEQFMRTMGNNQREMLEFLGDKMAAGKDKETERKERCPLTSGEIENLEGDLEPKGISAWWHEFCAGIEGKIPNVKDIMSMPPTEKEPGGPYWESIQSDEQLKRADLLLAQSIMPCLKKDAGNVVAFKRRVRRQPEKLTSGYLLRNAILSRAGYRDPEEEDLAVKAFKEKDYYAAGMTAAKVEEATETMEDDLSALPSLLHEPNAQLQWMLRKMPVGASKEIADEHKHLRRELRRGQITGAIPWDTELLSRLIGVTIAGTSDGEVSAAEKGKGTSRPGTGGAKRGCTNCGSPGHRWFDNQCKNGTCADCGLAFCSKVHGKQCDAKGANRPEVGKVKNALGDARPQTLVMQMQEIWDKDHGRVTPPAGRGKGQKGGKGGKGRGGGRGSGGRGRAAAAVEEEEDDESDDEDEGYEADAVELELECADVDSREDRMDKKAGLDAKFKMGDGAPEELELLADASHTLDKSAVFALVLTMYGAEIAHVLKGVHMHIASSTEAEAYATGKAGELAEMAHEGARGIGIKLSGPTFVGTDNKANAMVGSGHALPSRLRHCLRRYRTFTERVERGEMVLGYVPDPENPSDFLTKWTTVDKNDRSVAYCMNARNAPKHPREGAAGKEV